ncbi:MAG: hypothetical protein IH598_11080 [Bacteroidales bacterium]|nr:hypothetical protein [Bacteroidales bacterium]
MQAIRQIVEVTGQTLEITLPDDFNEKQVEVIILPVVKIESLGKEFSHLRGTLNLTEEQYNEFQANVNESREKWESRI